MIRKTLLRQYSIVATCLLMSLSLWGQLNMKAGFTSMYTPALEYNSIINTFNLENEDRLESPMPELHLLNGIQVGFRYSFDWVMFDLTWENTLRRRLGFGEDANGSLFEREYFYNFNALSLSLETRVNPNLHFSVGVGRRTLRIRREIGSSDRRINIFDTPADQFYLQVKPIIVLSPSARTPLALAPFFIYPLDQINLGDFENDLGLQNPQDVRDRFLSFGLSLVYYYGRAIN